MKHFRVWPPRLSFRKHRWGEGSLFEAIMRDRRVREVKGREASVVSFNFERRITCFEHWQGCNTKQYTLRHALDDWSLKNLVYCMGWRIWQPMCGIWNWILETPFWKLSRTLCHTLSCMWIPPTKTLHPSKKNLEFEIFGRVQQITLGLTPAKILLIQQDPRPKIPGGGNKIAHWNANNIPNQRVERSVT